MNARRLASWAKPRVPRAALIADVLTLAAERDIWKQRAEHATRIADEAVAVAARYADVLAEEQARNAALAADLDHMVFDG